MLYLNVDSDTRPEKILVENLPGGLKTVRLTKHVEEYQMEDTPGRTMYRYNEVVFDAPAHLELDDSIIEESFDEWWAYGESWDGDSARKTDSTRGNEAMTNAQLTEAVKTIREQNALLEECLLEISETIYA